MSIIFAPELTDLFSVGPVSITDIDRLHGDPNIPVSRLEEPYEFFFWKGLLKVACLNGSTIRIVLGARANLPQGIALEVERLRADLKAHKRQDQALYRLIGMSKSAQGGTLELHLVLSSYAEQMILRKHYWTERGKHLDRDRITSHPGGIGTNVMLRTKDGKFVFADYPDPGMPPDSLSIVPVALTSEDVDADGIPDLKACALRGLETRLGVPAEAVERMEQVLVGTVRSGTCDVLQVADTGLTGSEIERLHAVLPEPKRLTRLRIVSGNPEAVARLFMTRLPGGGSYPFPTSAAVALVYQVLVDKWGQEATDAAILQRKTPAFLNGTQRQYDEWNS
ncbi:hypothetical protein [Ktedonospora formicarum]|uniref:Uncharacterized protein n=1 Tax=Ktedonospora formicarum TaxID=2778364 RepID=A0A8J3IBC1_9CHLR|nr:hypothetical protein [Ktedonospora formicarum]GHO50783.1 hypothetical protein KSX_89460 [Ktedonospora formicarum]